MRGGCQQNKQSRNVLGKTTVKEVERALRNLFRLRIRLGMLDPPARVPYNQLRYNQTELQFNPAHVAVRRTKEMTCR